MLGSGGGGAAPIGQGGQVRTSGLCIGEPTAAGITSIWRVGQVAARFLPGPASGPFGPSYSYILL